MSEHVSAPFTTEQVDHLNEFQRSGYMHPFTCGTPNCPVGVLTATENGWVCGGCDHTQQWAHSFMVDGSAVKAHREMWARFGKESA